MGKAALIAVFAAGLLVSAFRLSSARTAHETDQLENQYEHRVLSREIAQSAFNVAMGRLRADFNGYRSQRRSIGFNDGWYDLRVTGPASGPVRVQVDGTFAQAVYRIDAVLALRGRSRPEPLTLDGPVDRLTLNGRAYEIDGTGSGQPAHAIRVTDSRSVDAVRAAIHDPSVTGFGGIGDVVAGPTELDFAALASSIVSHPAVVAHSGNTRFRTSDSIGSAAHPAFVVVNGDLRIDGSFEGYGALLVRGELRMDGNARWNGLVIAEGGPLDLRGHVQIAGAVAVRALGAPISARIAGNVRLALDTAALRALGPMMPSLVAESSKVAVLRADEGPVDHRIVHSATRR